MINTTSQIVYMSLCAPAQLHDILINVLKRQVASVAEKCSQEKF